MREKEEWNKKKDWTHEEVLNMRNKIKNKQILAMDEWENENEGFTKDPKLQDEYSKIMGGILEGYEDEKKMNKQIIERKYEPKTPDIVFLGLILVNFFHLKILPKT